MPKYSYGAEANGVMPWLQDRYDPSRTTLLDTATTIPVEQVASLAPDVVLAPYEGFDQGTYENFPRSPPPSPTRTRRGRPAGRTRPP